MGTNVTKALNYLQNNKAAASHSHTTSTLPVSNTQVNSDAYIPTSSLVYSMNSTLTSLNNIKTGYGTSELTPGSSSLTTGKIYCVYE